jgi:hypothetical protein
MILYFLFSQRPRYRRSQRHRRERPEGSQRHAGVLESVCSPAVPPIVLPASISEEKRSDGLPSPA